MKRIITIALALLLIFSLVGCKANKREIIQLTLSTEDSEAILAAAGIYLPTVEEVACANSNVKWFAWHDPFHNYAEDEIVNTGYWTFTQKYGCEIEWIETTWDDRFADLANAMLSENAPDFYPADTDIFPTYALKGMFEPVNDYIDYDDPMWEGTAHTAREFFSLGDKEYLIITDITTERVVAYNTRVIDEWGFDRPTDLYFNDEWTWDVFYDMCLEFTDPDEDRYALDGWYYSASLIDSSGVAVVTYDPETKAFVSNLDDPRIERAATLCADLRKNGVGYPVWDRDYVIRDDIEGGGIGDGLCLFYIIGTWGFTGPVSEIAPVWGDIANGEVMFVPLPRDPSGDGNYYCAVRPNGYCLIKGGSNHEGVALLAACERFKILDPTVISIYEKQMKEVYLWSDEMMEMGELIHDAANSEYVIVNYDDGLGSRVNNSAEEIKNIGRKSSAKTFAQMKEQYGSALANALEKLNQDVTDYIATMN